jgi:putative transposase
MAGFIVAQRAEHDIPHATACRALGVSQAWLYKWRHGDASPRHARRAQLTAAIRQLFAAHRGAYGSPRITADLRAAGWRVSENTVAAIMREQHLVARAKKRRRSSTRPGRGRWRAPDLIGRDFAAEQVNRKWYGDGTEIGTDEGKLFLDSVLDVGSRRIVGFALGEHHDADLAYASTAMAVAVRGGRENVAGVILHTDQGSEGEIKWSSQHLDDGGVGWRQCGGARQRAGEAGRAVGGSGRRIGRCGHRCVRLDARSRRGRCSGRSGG